MASRVGWPGPMLRFVYGLARTPLTMIEDGLESTMGDSSAEVLAWRRVLGAADRIAGDLLDDATAIQRGEALRVAVFAAAHTNARARADRHAWQRAVARRRAIDGAERMRRYRIHREAALEQRLQEKARRESTPGG
ncbi:hypothetical protein [Antrihabitans cavernicola]|uniref:Uncharacterized protein n=1 Tax=Antrihabitans cavernicola TaxID=2495913 RepID=A0A5A7S5D8_9NOCA|nr:hypothetical protein [Spelaeibacter cavernicola]KAA0017664.1 hypothetical protein FOY51_24820 [Spelaeibacter cavernicola]